MKDEQLLLDKATEPFQDDKYVNIVSFNEEENCIDVGVRSLMGRVLPSFLELEDKTKIELKYYESPPITNSLGDLNEVEPAQLMEDIHSDSGASRIKGGMICGVHGTTKVGTVTLSGVRMGVVSGRYKCFNSYFGFLSNAHVLVSGTSKKIWVMSREENKSTFECSIPLNKKNIHIDFALARIDPQHNIPTGSILSIGRIREQGAASAGMQIQKYGAISGYSQGTVTRKTNIFADGRWWRGVYESSGGFACQGDSGSAVIDSNLKMIGVHSWSELLPCQNDPKGYFYPTPPAKELGFDLCSDLIEEDVG